MKAFLPRRSRWRPRWRKRLAPLLSTPLMPLAVVIFGGASGYRLTEGWDWGDCFWQVAITLTTVGYGDQAITSPAGRWVTVLMLLGGIVVVQQTLQWLLSLQETGYFQRRRRWQRMQELQRMRNHVIVCGYGRIGREIAEQLSAEGIAVLVIETDPGRITAARDRHLEVLNGDATLDETLQEAGIKQCRSLVAALPNNAANLYVVLSARGLCSSCRLIARADSGEAERKLRQAGADSVVSPYIAGGRIMAATALRPLALNFLDLLAGSNCEVEEFQLVNNPNLAHEVIGRSLIDLDLGRRSGGALVLAIHGVEGLVANPSGHTTLAPGQRLVVMGSPKQLEALEGLLGAALESSSAVQG
ncbi:TrkA family potassium uptake protein [uncultured Synechococcus sp.]|uniref:potassium channel family protein n=1 Tax=uncultured Synechococcus sp. TaxID=154535 RepID=UPI0025984B7B|nr:potassium channel protein [uncultured Synechococcus sp.]